MVVIMKRNASQEEIEAVIANLSAFGFNVHRSSGVNQTVLGAIGVKPGFDHRIIRGLKGVSDVKRVTEAYKLASRAGRNASTIVDVGGLRIGGHAITVMAGPGSVESEEQIRAMTAQVACNGASLFRGNILKPRTSFYEFYGVEEGRLELIREAADRGELKVAIEVTDVARLDMMSEYADILQVGARNMQNFELLRALGTSNKPILLERGLSATIEEWLMSAEYVMRCGNTQIILCERGIRTFESATRYTLDLSAVSVVKAKSHLPVFVDPCRSTGMRNYIIPLARAAVAAGADGVMVDVHHDPANASGAGLSALNFDQFAELIVQIRDVAKAVGRSLTEGGETNGPRQ
ncbi:MAG: 3-deoxy-7-phosphoheptulonate synthase [Rhodothermaceae bacterium]|nr:3-deoxy-7-phosphoheptulonate synthase [Rhodothermaceae bacterium]